MKKSSSATPERASLNHFIAEFIFSPFADFVIVIASFAQRREPMIFVYMRGFFLIKFDTATVAFSRRSSHLNVSYSIS